MSCAYYTRFLCTALLISLLFLQGKEKNNNDISYIDLNDITEIIIRISSFDKNTNSPLHYLKKAIEDGSHCAQYNDVIEALIYADLLIQKENTQLNTVEKQILSEDLDKILVTISNNSPTRAPNLRTLVVNENLYVMGKTTLRKHINAKQGIHCQGHLNVNKSSTFKKNVTIKGALAVKNLSVNSQTVGILSVNDAIIQNLTLSGSLAFTSLSVDDLNVNNTLSATDAAIDNLSVANCMTSLCVNSLSVVDFAASGTFSASDAAIQNLTLTGALSFNDLSVVDQSISGSLSVNDQTINGNLEITSFASSGVVHNDINGLLTTSLITNADIDSAAAIDDTKLATISAAGKVANSATTCTSDNNINTIVLRDISGDFSAGTITANLNGNATTATTATNATNFTGPLVGDVTGTQNATVVSFIGGETAANVAAGSALANAATSANTASTIIMRDASGNFITNGITIVGSISNPNDAATKAYVDNAIGGGGTSSNIPNTLVLRDALGSFATTMIVLSGITTNPTDAATKAYVDSAVIPSTGTSINLPNTIVQRDATGSFSAQNISSTDNIISGNILLASSTSSSVGNILKNGSRFIHNTGTNNTFMGVNAGNFSTSGTGQNSAFGVNALTGVTTGTNNIAIGYQAGQSISTGSGNIYINANAVTSNESSTIRIGTSQTNCFIAGISSTGVSGDVVTIDNTGQLGITLSSKRFKNTIQNMGDFSDNVLKLRPVTFIYNDNKAQTTEFGLIAEEVEEIFPEIVTYDEYGKPYTVRYHLLPILLLNELQKQKNIIEQLEKTIQEIKNQQLTVQTMENAIYNLRTEIQDYINNAITHQ